MRRPTEDDLAKVAVARTAQGEIVAVGVVMSYCDSPTVRIATASGEQIHWRADLCEVLPLAEDVADYIGRGIISPDGEV